MRTDRIVPGHVPVHDERRPTRHELELQNTELRERVARLEQLLEILPIGVAVAEDRACTRVAVNGALANLLRIPTSVNISATAPEPAALPFRWLRHGAPVPANELPLQYAAARGEDVEMELELVHGHGRPSIVWVAARPLLSPDGTPVGATCVVQDVTTQRRDTKSAKFISRASEILAGSLDLTTTLDNLARLIVPQIADAYVVDLVADGGRVERASERFARPEEARPYHALRQVLPLHEVPEHPVHDVIRTGVPFFADGRDGAIPEKITTHPELIKAFQHFGLTSLIIVPMEARGRTLGTISMATTGGRRRFDRKDLTVAAELARRAAMAVDNARLLAAAERLREDAQRANRAKSDFLATMSHELRTPLNAIGGYTQLLLMGLRGELTSAQRSDLERVEQNQRHLLGLINAVLNFVKLDAGMVHYDVGEVSLRAVLESIEGMIAPQVQVKGLRYHYDPCGASVTVLADEEKVRQILLNLVSNAVKFTPPDGEISLGCQVAEKTVDISVRDTGIGIADARLETIFEPFVQVDRTLSTLHEGVGLGLSISRSLARGMGGDITVASRQGEGSTFTLTLRRP